MIILFNSYIFILVSTFSLLSSCGNNLPANQVAKDEITTQAKTPLKTAPISKPPIPEASASSGQNNKIAPGTCRIVGKIIAVLPDLDKDKTNPCGNVPCQARVKVMRILGYGSGFGQPIGNGSEINLYFNFTLSETKKYFPELTRHLPGLKVGQSFQADIKPTGDNNIKSYLVNDYVVK